MRGRILLADDGTDIAIVLFPQPPLALMLVMMFMMMSD
jgi:hypothetical protein